MYQGVAARGRHRVLDASLVRPATLLLPVRCKRWPLPGARVNAQSALRGRAPSGIITSRVLQASFDGVQVLETREMVYKLTCDVAVPIGLPGAGAAYRLVVKFRDILGAIPQATLHRPLPDSAAAETPVVEGGTHGAAQATNWSEAITEDGTQGAAWDPEQGIYPFRRTSGELALAHSAFSAVALHLMPSPCAQSAFRTSPSI